MIKPDEFWNQTKEEGGCKLWTGLVNRQPAYGVFQVMGGRLIAHRVAYELAHGELPKHAHVIRSCGNPLCVSPDHLRLANSLKSTDPVADLKVKIENAVDKVENDCWVWKGPQPKSLILPAGVRLFTRGIYEVFHTPLRKSQELLPNCGRVDCCNPDHLKPQERADLGRHNAKLTIDDVKAIRAMVIAGPINVGELARKFNTSRQTIYSVVYNKGWFDASYSPPEKVAKIITKPKKSIEERFWAKVDKSQDCWIWTAYKHNGFGHFSIDHVPKMAHRVAYELKNGQIPPGMRVLHTCENDLCVNPDHLYTEGKMAAR